MDQFFCGTSSIWFKIVLQQLVIFVFKIIVIINLFEIGKIPAILEITSWLFAKTLFVLNNLVLFFLSGPKALRG